MFGCMAHPKGFSESPMRRYCDLFEMHLHSSQCLALNSLEKAERNDQTSKRPINYF